MKGKGKWKEELVFNPKKLKFTHKPEANVWIKAPKRGDWDFSIKNRS